MKKLIPFISLILFCSFTYSQDKHRQYVSPDTVYLGENVHIKYDFQTGADFFDGETIELTTDYDSFNRRYRDFFVKKMSLSCLGSEYTLHMDIIPWKTGTLEIPPFDLNALVKKSGTDNSSPFYITLEPVQVHSIAAKLGVNQLEPPEGPKTVPGTTAFLVLAFIAAFIILSLIFFALLKLPVFKKFLIERHYAYRTRKNAGNARSQLKRLWKNSSRIQDDKKYALKVQEIMRSYCNGRFTDGFEALTPPQFYAYFTELAGGDITERQEEGVMSLMQIFSRCDYIRFATDETTMLFDPNERRDMVKNACAVIENFESDERREEE